jgi:hypothetical protein
MPPSACQALSPPGGDLIFACLASWPIDETSRAGQARRSCGPATAKNASMSGITNPSVAPIHRAAMTSATAR